MLLIALSLTAFPTLQAQQCSTYHVFAEVLPGKQLSIDIDMNFVPEESTNRLEFLLHGDLRIISLASQQMDSYNIQQENNPFGLDTAYVQLVKIESNRKVVAGDSIPLSWQYRGEFKNDHFQLGPSAFYKGWADLEVGSLWLPTLSNLQQQFHTGISDMFATFVSQNTFKMMRLKKQLFGDDQQKTTLRVVVPHRLVRKIRPMLARN